MIANASTYKDVNKYYQNTYVVVPEVEPKQVQQLLKSTPEGIWLRNPVTEEEGHISFEGGYSYSLQSPLATRRQWFSYKNNAYLIERIPARMWRKGICVENTCLHTLGPEGLKSVPLHPERLNSLLQFQAPTDFTKMNGVTSTALSDMFALGGKNNSLFLWDTPIGKYAARTKEMFVCRELQGMALPPVFNNFKIKYV